jgi:hypothetical protein
LGPPNFVFFSKCFIGANIFWGPNYFLQIWLHKGKRLQDSQSIIMIKLDSFFRPIQKDGLPNIFQFIARPINLCIGLNESNFISNLEHRCNMGIFI